MAPTPDANDADDHEIASGGTVIYDGSIQPDAAQLSTLRRAARRALEAAGLTRNACEDVVLIISELVSNAITAADASSWIGVALRRSGETITVTVDNDGAPLPAGTPVLPAPDAPRGRGLAIVSSLAHRVSTDHRDGRSRVSATYQPASSQA
jgi:anti-sigma regulatory factor (Ser/Thr protein kinase)